MTKSAAQPLGAETRIAQAANRPAAIHNASGRTVHCAIPVETTRNKERLILDFLLEREGAT